MTDDLAALIKKLPELRATAERMKGTDRYYLTIDPFQAIQLFDAIERLTKELASAKRFRDAAVEASDQFAEKFLCAQERAEAAEAALSEARAALSNARAFVKPFHDKGADVCIQQIDAALNHNWSSPPKP